MEDQHSAITQKILGAMRKENVSLERLETLSGVSGHHLSLLMEGKYEKLPAAPYVRGYMLKIAKVLGLNGEELWQEFAENSEELRTSGKHDTLPENRFMSKNALVRICIVIGILVAVLAIAGIRMLFLDNPNIKFNNLEDEITTVRSSPLMIEGSLKPGFKLTLNGEEIVVDAKGSFTEEVNLGSGFNTLVFAAKKVLGKEHRFPKQVFYESPGMLEGGEASTSTRVAPEEERVIE
ncbi:MAG: helix-turn-helix domain-containing protein [bacterium]|nr:helix-turn-helix domain-containing protein [bacterium]